MPFCEDVKRVPLKFDHGVNEEEEAHLRASSDGLRYFIPLEIHSAVVTKWFSLGLPVSELLVANHTVFSEESGEIALSVLTHAQPVNNRTDIKATRGYWHMTNKRYEALRVRTLCRDSKNSVLSV